MSPGFWGTFFRPRDNGNPWALAALVIANGGVCILAYRNMDFKFAIFLACCCVLNLDKLLRLGEAE